MATLAILSLPMWLFGRIHVSDAVRTGGAMRPSWTHLARWRSFLRNGLSSILCTMLLFEG